MAQRLLWINRLLALLVVGILVATCWVGYQKIVGNDGGEGSPEVKPGEPSYSDLEIFDNAGDFGGTITIRNPLDRDVEIFVTVDVYNGEQNVGDLRGSVSLKPDSQSTVDLQGFDDYVSYTDARVDLLGLPK